jgi:hypothetical protein
MQNPDYLMLSRYDAHATSGTAAMHLRDSAPMPPPVRALVNSGTALTTIRSARVLFICAVLKVIFKGFGCRDCAIAYIRKQFEWDLNSLY